MNKALSKYYFFYLTILLLTMGCSDNKTTTNEESMVSTSNNIANSVQKDDETKPNKQAIVKKPELEIENINSIFKDSDTLVPNGKYMIMLFDSIDCHYCTKLKKDILENEKLKNRIKNDFSAYKLSLDENKLYKFLYNGKIVNADTNLLKNIYAISSTPTILFDDKDAKNILIIPGYISPEQFNATLDFIEKGLWKDKDRKNGEVYTALEKYYKEKGFTTK